MTTGCDGPMPSASRPFVAAWVDSACCAMAKGWRGYVGITAVPSSIRRVTWPASASAVRPSRLQGMCGTHPVVKPARLGSPRRREQLVDARAGAARVTDEHTDPHRREPCTHGPDSAEGPACAMLSPHQVSSAPTSGAEGGEQMADLGPVELLFVEFPGNQFSGEIAPALQELVQAGTIRVIDLVFVAKDADGNVVGIELEDLHEDAAWRLQPARRGAGRVDLRRGRRGPRGGARAELVGRDPPLRERLGHEVPRRARELGGPAAGRGSRSRSTPSTKSPPRSTRRADHHSPITRRRGDLDATHET